MYDALEFTNSPIHRLTNSQNPKKPIATLKIIIVALFLMNFWRVLLAILFPPLAVIDKGCGSVVLVFILTVCGWIPGVIAALIILNNPNR